MTKHTFGRWAIDPDDRPDMEWNNHIVRADQPNMTICFMAHSGKPDNSEFEAYARLIAAAPDLLEALQGLLADINEYQTINNLGGENNHWQVRARAAIAKATNG